MITEDSESFCGVIFLPLKNQSQLICDLGTQNLQPEKKKNRIETRNKQNSEFYTPSSQNIFSPQQAIGFPNYWTRTLNQILILLLPELLIERKDLFWSHMLRNACSYNYEFVCHAFCHISLLKRPFLKMIPENTTTSPHPFLKQPQNTDLKILSSLPNPSRSKLATKGILA